MLRNRPLLALAIAALLGIAGGVGLARVSDDNPAPAPGEVIGLGQRVTLASVAGTLDLAYPDDWYGGQARVNCDTATDAHVSTDDVALASLVRTVGDGQTCTSELDPRPLSPGGAYVSAAFFEFADVACGESLPTTPPPSLAAMKLDAPSGGTLREFGAEGSYDGFEWRHTTWCLPGGYAVRLEVFIGHTATKAVRDRAEVIVKALRVLPAG